MNFRIGYGYDVHRLAEGETLWLGGVLVPHSKGTVAHSDGDVLIHALCDAMLGAAKMGDIGRHFPDTSSDYKNIDSKILLHRTNELIASKNYRVGNLDVTVATQYPKLKPYIPEMEKTLAEILGIDVDSVSIKATTTEELGFEGREEGISVHAVVLLVSTIEDSVLKGLKDSEEGRVNTVEEAKQKIKNGYEKNFGNWGKRKPRSIFE